MHHPDLYMFGSPLIRHKFGYRKNWESIIPVLVHHLALCPVSFPAAQPFPSCSAFPSWSSLQWYECSIHRKSKRQLLHCRSKNMALWESCWRHYRWSFVTLGSFSAAGCAGWWVKSDWYPITAVIDPTEPIQVGHQVAQSRFSELYHQHLVDNVESHNMQPCTVPGLWRFPKIWEVRATSLEAPSRIARPLSNFPKRQIIWSSDQRVCSVSN